MREVLFTRKPRALLNLYRSDLNFSLAVRTTINGPHSKMGSRNIGRDTLKKRFLPAGVAICTYLMGWLDSLGIRFHLISKAASKRLQFVTFFLCIPCFQFSIFFFQMTYSSNQRMALLVRREDCTLSFENSTLQFDDLRLRL